MIRAPVFPVAQPLLAVCLAFTPMCAWSLPPDGFDRDLDRGCHSEPASGEESLRISPIKTEERFFGPEPGLRMTKLERDGPACGIRAPGSFSAPQIRARPHASLFRPNRCTTQKIRRAASPHRIQPNHATDQARFHRPIQSQNKSPTFLPKHGPPSQTDNSATFILRPPAVFLRPERPGLNSQISKRSLTLRDLGRGPNSSCTCGSGQRKADACKIGFLTS